MVYSRSGLEVWLNLGMDSIRGCRGRVRWTRGNEKGGGDIDMSRGREVGEGTG